MSGGETRTAAQEWGAHWPLVLAALVGYMALGLQSYGFSPFVTHVEQAFGWTRAQTMIGVSVSNFCGIFLNVLVGLLIDKIGSRKVGLAGLVVMTAAFASLGTATGSEANWIMLWVFIAIGVVLTQATVWSRAVAKFFDKSRGMAMAVALCGSPLSALFVPVIATSLVAHFGWRGGFYGVAAIWLIVTLPVVYFLFHDGDDRLHRDSEADAMTPRQPPAELPGYTFREGLRTRAFFHLLLSFGCFSFYSMTIATNLVPLLSETGITAMQAGAIASIMGLVGIGCRISVGFLLDRFAGPIIGTITLLLPVIGCSILLMDHPGTLLLSLAVASFGAAIGAEVDVALYLATRHFGLKSFAALFSAIITYGAVNAAAGPIIGGWLHDLSGNYDMLLMTIMAIMTIGAIAMATIGKPQREWGLTGH